MDLGGRPRPAEPMNGNVEWGIRRTGVSEAPGAGPVHGHRHRLPRPRPQELPEHPLAPLPAWGGDGERDTGFNGELVLFSKFPPGKQGGAQVL